MEEKSTKELSNVLKNTHLSGFNKYCRDNMDSLDTDSRAFYTYIRALMAEKKITQHLVFMRADIPERYGYKLLSGERRTRQRDVILRICYCAEFTLPETQRALKKYGMSELYAKIPRDALIMIAFNERPGDIETVNEVLIKNNMEPLRASGHQE